MIIVNFEWCKGCNICIDCCPVNALVESKKVNKKGVHPPELINEDKCISCKLCELNCPDLAIFVVSDKEKKDSSEE